LDLGFIEFNVIPDKELGWVDRLVGPEYSRAQFLAVSRFEAAAMTVLRVGGTNIQYCTLVDLVHSTLLSFPDFLGDLIMQRASIQRY
jgi:hypothetical protein